MFKSARIRLTLLYVFIVTVITFSFSGFIYLGISNAANRALHSHENKMMLKIQERGGMKRPMPENFQKGITQETVEDIKHSVFTFMALLNLVIITLSGFLSYFFAGKTLNPIEHAMKKQDEFISNAAHDLKTPLAVIKTELEVTLRDKKLKLSESKQVLKDTLEQINKLVTLTQLLVEDNRYKNYKGDLDIEKVNLSKILNEVVSDLKAASNKKNISIQTKVSKIELCGNEKSLYRLFNVLVENAIKYNKENGQVNIAASKNKNTATITVKDTGIGISKEEQDCVFERFYRGDKSRNTNGHGLGLAIAKDIVDIHNGTISLESELEKGSTFTVKLPLDFS